MRDLGSIPGLGSSPKQEKGYPLQYSSLENSMDGIVHGVTKSQIQLSNFHFHFSVNIVTQSCLTLCSPMGYRLPGSSVHGIFHVRILEWVAISSSRGSSWPRNWIHVSCISRWILYQWATREAPQLGNERIKKFSYSIVKKRTKKMKIIFSGPKEKQWLQETLIS